MQLLKSMLVGAMLAASATSFAQVGMPAPCERVFLVVGEQLQAVSLGQLDAMTFLQTVLAVQEHFPECVQIAQQAQAGRVTRPGARSFWLDGGGSVVTPLGACTAAGCFVR